MPCAFLWFVLQGASLNDLIKIAKDKGLISHLDVGNRLVALNRQLIDGFNYFVIVM